jgi:hypothetical protein
MSVDALERILLPPASASEVPDRRDWGAIESRLGTALPADYKEFITSYGTGKINDFLVVLNPFSQNRYVNLLNYARSNLAAYDESKARFPKHYLYDTYPAPGGILPFAATDNANSVYWRTNGVPERWTVTVYESRGPKHFGFNGGMTEFLTAVLTRAIKCTVFPDDFVSSRPTFTPAAWFCPPNDDEDLLPE